jgi:hypothetical protein
MGYDPLLPQTQSVKTDVHCQSLQSIVIPSYPVATDFVQKRKAPSNKARCYKLFKMFFPLTMTGFFDTRKGEILMSMILELKFPKKIFEKKE